DAEGGLVLTSRASLLEGGETGPAVVAGQADASLLIQLIEHRVKPFMPPKNRRRPRSSEIAILKKWIADGARPFPSLDGPRSLEVPSVPTRGTVRQPVNALVVAPDGSWYALARTGRVDLLVLPVDPKRPPLATLAGIPGQVSDLALSRDGRQLVTAAGEPGLFGETRVYEIAKRVRKAAADKVAILKRIIRGHSDSLNTVALSADGQLLATGSYDRTIVVWNTSNGERLLELSGHNGPVLDLAFDPKNRFLASASGDRTVKLWHLKTGKRLDTFIEPTKGQNTVAVSPDGRFVVAGGIDNRIRVWEITDDGREGTNPIRFSRFAHQAPLLDLVFTNDGKHLVSASEDLSIKTWTTNGFHQDRHFPNQPDWPATVAVTRDGTSLLVGRLDGSTAILSLADATQTDARPVPLTQATVPSPQQDLANDNLSKQAETEPNNTPAKASTLAAPGVATGVLAGASHDTPNTAEDVDLFRFSSNKDQSWVIETRAARDKSPADTRIEVLDDDGRPLIRLLLRAVRDSAITFRPIDSRTNQARLDNWEEMGLNQFLYMSGEVVKNYRMPRGPDSGMQFYTIRGQRHCYFDTSATSHALDTKVYIVEPHRPGSRLPDNGLPVFPLYFANDDDGHRKLGSDSQLIFTAPETGHYLVKVTDVRGFGGKDFKYQLTIRQPRPAFKATLGGRDATIPEGSGQRFTVKLDRIDGFHGPVKVTIDNLPDGFTATSPIVVEAGHLEAQGVINVAKNAKAPEKDAWGKVTVVAHAMVLGKPVEQPVGNLGTLKIGKPPKAVVTLKLDADTPADEQQPVLIIAPGQTITAMLDVQRNGYDGDLNFDVENLPHGVIVDNIGLSGVLVRAKETRRQIYITAADWVPETRRLIHAVSRQEGKQASAPLRFEVRQLQPTDRPTTDTSPGK
ncbi:MAG: c-type cytochrome domain-containing protein, partial [Planctomycetaceae bacterium]